jgi:glucokinase
MSNSKQNVVIGIDLGGTTIKAGVVSSEGSILYQNKVPTFADRGPGAVVRQIDVAVKDAMGKMPDAAVTGVGIGSPGVVDDEGVVKSPPNFAQWDEVPLKQELTKLFPGLVVGVENDANAAAIAESKFGAGVKFPDFLFVIWGTGVGGGIIMNHKIFRRNWAHND